MSNWHTIMGRLADSVIAEDRKHCEHPDCRIEGAPYLARTDWIGAGPVPSSHESPRFRRFCAKHAAAFAHSYGLPFPPGMWKGDTIGKPPQVFEIPEGTPAATCASCRELIRWIVTANDRRMPVNLDGTSHFVSCPNANAHRRRR